MSQITGPLTIHDGAATPVARSFAPMRVAPEQSVFSEKTSGIAAGYVDLEVKFNPASTQRPTNRIDVAVTLPVLSTVNGISTVAYTGLFKGYFVVPDVMTAAERANLHAYVANALNHATVKAVVKDLDPMY